MEYSYYDKSFIDESMTILSENDLNILNSIFYFDLINDVYPFNGSRINYDKLKNSKHSKLSKSHTFNDASKFIFGVIEDNNLKIEEKIIYIGDGLTEYAYEFKLKNLIKLLPFILEIPQHHYFISQNEKWCLTISFESDIEFGMLPVSAN